MSDWFGVYSLTESINAGLDLEMPGIEVWRTHEKVHRSISAHKVTPRTVKERARKVLEMVKKVCKTNSEVRGSGFTSEVRPGTHHDLTSACCVQIHPLGH